MTNKECLPVFHSPDGMEEIIKWVTSRPKNDVAYWVEQILKKNRQAYPELLWESEQKVGNTGTGALVTIMRAEHDLTFQQNIWDGLQLLTECVQWNYLYADDVEYVKNLLTAIGSLKVQPLQDALIKLTDQKTLVQEDLGEEGPRLHVTALASLGAFGCNERTVHIFERDIQEPLYAGLCYRVLWKFDRKYAGQYANLIRDIGSRNTHFPVDMLLKEAGLLTNKVF